MVQILYKVLFLARRHVFTPQMQQQMGIYNSVISYCSFLDSLEVYY